MRTVMAKWPSASPGGADQPKTRPCTPGRRAHDGADASATEAGGRCSWLVPGAGTGRTAPALCDRFAPRKFERRLCPLHLAARCRAVRLCVCELGVPCGPGTDRWTGGWAGRQEAPMIWLAAGHLRGDRPLPSVLAYGAGWASWAGVDDAPSACRCWSGEVMDHESVRRPMATLSRSVSSNSLTNAMSFHSICV